MYPRGRRSSGFTLIELMVVITIIAVLAAILVPNFVHARSQGQMSGCESNLKNISTGLEMYSNENEGRYPGALASLVPSYLRAVPTCPAATIDTYTGGFASISQPDSYSVVCSGLHHIGVGQDTNYPQYNSTAGLNRL